MSEKIPSNRLKQLREGSKLTLKEVGKILDKDYSTISAHECGHRRITDADVETYAKLYKVPAHHLFVEPQA